MKYNHRRMDELEPEQCFRLWRSVPLRGWLFEAGDSRRGALLNAHAYSDEQGNPVDREECWFRRDRRVILIETRDDVIPRTRR